MKYVKLFETYSDIQGFVIVLMPTEIHLVDSTDVDDYSPVLVSATTKLKAESLVKKWYYENHPDNESDKEVVKSDWEDFKKRCTYYEIKDLKKTVIGI